MAQLTEEEKKLIDEKVERAIAFGNRLHEQDIRREAHRRKEAEKREAEIRKAMEVMDRENKGKPDLPDELNNETFKAIIKKAVKEGYCDENYNWKYTLVLLSYFVNEMSRILGLNHHQYLDNKTMTSWKPFGNLFTIKGKKVGKDKLKGAKQDNMQKNGGDFEPQGYKGINNILRGFEPQGYKK